MTLGCQGEHENNRKMSEQEHLQTNISKHEHGCMSQELKGEAFDASSIHRWPLQQQEDEEQQGKASLFSLPRVD